MSDNTVALDKVSYHLNDNAAAEEVVLERQIAVPFLMFLFLNFFQESVSSGHDDIPAK